MALICKFNAGPFAAKGAGGRFLGMQREAFECAREEILEPGSQAWVHFEEYLPSICEDLGLPNADTPHAREKALDAVERLVRRQGQIHSSSRWFSSEDLSRQLLVCWNAKRYVVDMSLIVSNGLPPHQAHTDTSHESVKSIFETCGGSAQLAVSLLLNDTMLADIERIRAISLA